MIAIRPLAIRVLPNKYKEGAESVVGPEHAVYSWRSASSGSNREARSAGM
jgi:hypothetical protein